MTNVPMDAVACARDGLAMCSTVNENVALSTEFGYQGGRKIELQPMLATRPKRLGL
jgi:hypothetical protein